MSDLLPCPFCGGEADVMLSQSRWGQSYTIHHDTLRKCPAEYVGSMQFATETEAIAAWNSRAERICEMETDHDELEVIACSHEDTWAYKCSACDWSFRYNRGIKPSYCPNCGCKVVSE